MSLTGDLILTAETYRKMVRKVEQAESVLRKEADAVALERGLAQSGQGVVVLMTADGNTCTRRLGLDFSRMTKIDLPVQPAMRFIGDSPVMPTSPTRRTYQRTGRHHRGMPVFEETHP